jgi:hypothetical protein
MIGGGFQHSISTNDSEPKYIEWTKDGSSEISIHIDDGILKPTNPLKKNYGWLCESKTIINSLYVWCENNIEFLKLNYIKVFTHDVKLSNMSDIFELTLCSSKSYLTQGNIYDKKKLVSMVASNKVLCEDHRFRQLMIKKYSNKCDHFGRGYNPIKNKEDGLKDYCFSFAMENATYPNMFTEKITDCFMTGTIPIYYGINNIGDYFNTDGIITLDDNFKIEDLSFDLYYSKMDAVIDNFKRSIDFPLAEDYIFKTFIEGK